MPSLRDWKRKRSDPVKKGKRKGSLGHAFPGEADDDDYSYLDDEEGGWSCWRTSRSLRS